MRQLKTFMRNRKKEMLACGPCECRTLQCWRYANENCGCGEWGSEPEPTVVDVEAITLAESIDLVMWAPTNYSIEYMPTNADAEWQISFWWWEWGICNLDSISYSEWAITFLLTPQAAGTDSLIVYLRWIEYGAITINVEPETTDYTLNITPSDQDTFIMDTMTWNQVTFPVNVVSGQQLVQNGTGIMLREWCDDPNIVGGIPGYIWIADYQLMKWEDNYPISCEWYINWEPWPTNEFEEDGETFLKPQEILIEWDVNLRAEEVYDEGWE